MNARFAFACVAGLIMSVVLLTWHSTAQDDPIEQIERGSTLHRSLPGSGLFMWSNHMDDGTGAWGQHGSTGTIGSACDPDDPACTFHTAGDHTGWAQGRWVSANGRREKEARSFSVQVPNVHVGR